MNLELPGNLPGAQSTSGARINPARDLQSPVLAAAMVTVFDLFLVELPKFVLPCFLLLYPLLLYPLLLLR